MLENYSNPEIVYRNARIVYGPNVQIKPSTHAGKKYMLLNPETNKWFHFGKFP